MDYPVEVHQMSQDLDLFYSSPNCHTHSRDDLHFSSAQFPHPFPKLHVLPWSSVTIYRDQFHCFLLYLYVCCCFTSWLSSSCFSIFICFPEIHTWSCFCLFRLFLCIGFWTLACFLKNFYLFIYLFFPVLDRCPEVSPLSASPHHLTP